MSPVTILLRFRPILSHLTRLPAVFNAVGRLGVSAQTGLC